MSTSPSWFDQEKFSRLVKNLGPKGAAPAATGAASRNPPRSPEKDTRRLLRALGSSGSLTAPAAEPAKAPPTPPPARSTGPLPSHVPPIRAPESLEKEPLHAGFPSPLPVPEPRSVSPLARRTTSLPNLKPIFEYDKPEDRPAAPEGEEAAEKIEAPISAESFSSGWPISSPGMSEPAESEEAEEPEETAPSSETGDVADLRAERDALAARVQELSRAAEERDEARNEAEVLRTQLQEADEIIQASAGGMPGGNAEELTRAIEERDSSRRDYANLREEFENYKQEQAKQGAKPDLSSFSIPSQSGGGDVEAKEQISGLEKTVETLKQELDAVQGQISQSRDETSVAQRGLALSQKALQETRDALREASEGYSQSKANLENLRSECSSLVQQNLSLQSQNEQLSRELSGLRKG